MRDIDHTREEVDQRRPVLGEGHDDGVSACDSYSHDVKHGIYSGDEEVPTVRRREAGTAVVQTCREVGPVKDPVASPFVGIPMRL